LSDVRVHDDPKAAKTARALNASAYTIGTEISFGSSQFSPETATGKKLIAHELTHVLQQSKIRHNRKVNDEPEIKEPHEAVPSPWSEKRVVNWFNWYWENSREEPNYLKWMLTIGVTIARRGAIDLTDIFIEENMGWFKLDLPADMSRVSKLEGLTRRAMRNGSISILENEFKTIVDKYQPSEKSLGELHPGVITYTIPPFAFEKKRPKIIPSEDIPFIVDLENSWPGLLSKINSIFGLFIRHISSINEIEFRSARVKYTEEKKDYTLLTGRIEKENVAIHILLRGQGYRSGEACIKYRKKDKFNQNVFGKHTLIKGSTKWKHHPIAGRKTDEWLWSLKY